MNQKIQQAMLLYYPSLKEQAITEWASTRVACCDAFDQGRDPSVKDACWHRGRDIADQDE